MIASRALLLILALMLIVLPLEADAQGRGSKTNGGKGGGPAFCRSGEGHPVHGWEWCRARGWDGIYRSGTFGRAVRRAEPRPRNASPERYRNRGVTDAAFDNGYADGYEKGLDDAPGGRGFDPTRHSWYRSADRHYDPSYGSRAAYANIYRDGFRSGYDAGFADGERYGGRGGTSRFPWPF